MLRVREGPWHAMHWRVPIDDTHTEIFWAGFMRAADAQRINYTPDPEHEGAVAIVNPDGEYAMTNFYSHDTMAWETQGAIFDRHAEHTGASDRGIAMYREMLKEQIGVVEHGDDPMALVWDEAANRVIEVPEWISEGDQEFLDMTGTRPTSTSMETVFDGRHEVFEVPFGKARPR
jgi:5,5'-dehydrodivanillate O-demethylase